MKYLQKFILIIFVFLAGLIISNQTFAYNPSLGNLKVTNIYDNHAGAIKLTFMLNNVLETPSKDYYIKVFFNNKYYTSDLIYDSSIDKMYSFMTINVSKNDLKNYYYINYYVLNNSNNYHEYSKLNYKLLISDSNGLNWKNTKVINTYDKSYRKLKLTFSLSNINTNPNINYYMKIKFNNKYYTSDLIYDSVGKKLYSFFSIDINKADLKNYYYINYYIVNNDSNTLDYTKLNLKLDVVNKENISWSAMNISNSYDKDNEYLELNFNLNNLKTKPSGKYSVKLNFGNTLNTTYNSDLIYDPENDKFNTTFLIDINRSDLKKYYYVSYTVYDSDNLKVYTKTNYQVNVSNYTSSYTYNNNNNNCLNNNSGYYYNSVYYTCNNTNYYNDNNISWSNLKISNTYSSYNKELNLDFYINDVYNTPQNNYYIKVYINGNYYTSYFNYESYNNKLHANLLIYLDNSYSSKNYYMSYNIIDDYLDTSKYSSATTIYIKNLNNNLDNSYNYSWDKINKIENNYSNISDRIYYVYKEIDYLNNNTNYYDYTFRDDAIKIFRDRIDYYNKYYN